MKWISPFLLFCFYVHAENLGIAPFDPDYESKFYSIYKNYHSQQMSVSEWQALISQKNVNAYTMQKGDNLWDISRMLFGNPNHWPKLWSVNADLSNPHRVAIGHKLQVIMGSEGQVPRAVISGQNINQGIPSSSAGETSILQGGSAAPLNNVISADSDSTEESFCVKDLGLILNKQGSTSVYDSEIKCKVLKNKLYSRKLKDEDRLKGYFLNQQEEDEDIGIQPFVPPGELGIIPNSLPPVKLTPARGVDIIDLGQNVSTSHKNVVVNYQVDSDDIDVVGEIFDMPDGISVPTSEIIVELDVPANVGDVFSVIQPMRKVRSRSFFISGPFGYEVVFQGQVRVTGSVPNREGLHFVEVVNMYNEINGDSKIIRETPSVFDFQSDVRSGQTRAQISAIPHDQSSLALTVHSFIYINRGSHNNVNVGDTFDIQANPRFHKRSFGKSLGRVVIVHTAGNFSTGFVTYLNDVAYPGDYLQPLGEAGYFSDAEIDDVYEEDEFYEEDEEDELESSPEDSLLEEEGDDISEDPLLEESEPSLEGEESFQEDESPQDNEAEIDDVYEEDEFYEEDELDEVESSPEDSLLEGEMDDMSEDSLLEDEADDMSEDPLLEESEPSLEGEESFQEGESPQDNEAEDDSFLDDFEDEELEWDEE